MQKINPIFFFIFYCIHFNFKVENQSITSILILPFGALTERLAVASSVDVNLPLKT